MSELPILKSIGKSIKEKRSEKEIKGQTLATALKKSKSAVSQMKSGLVDFKISQLQKIAELLKVDMHTLIVNNTQFSNNDHLANYAVETSLKIDNQIIEKLIERVDNLNTKIEHILNSKSFNNVTNQ